MVPFKFPSRILKQLYERKAVYYLHNGITIEGKITYVDDVWFELEVQDKPVCSKDRVYFIPTHALMAVMIDEPGGKFSDDDAI